MAAASFIPDASECARGCDRVLFSCASNAQPLRLDCAPDAGLLEMSSRASYMKLVKGADLLAVVPAKKNVCHFGVGQVFVDFAVQHVFVEAILPQRIDAVLAVQQPIHVVAMVDDGKAQLVQVQL